MSRRLRALPFLICSTIAMLWMATACISGECLDNKNSLPLAAFYSSQSSSQKISLDNIEVYGLDTPSGQLLMDSTTNASSVYLPFRIDEPQSTFIFHYKQQGLNDEAFNDTITFRYDIVPYFVSAACGAIYKYKVREIASTHHLIDSVKCTAPDSLIDNVAVENLAIYFRVQLQEAARR